MKYRLYFNGTEDLEEYIVAGIQEVASAGLDVTLDEVFYDHERRTPDEEIEFEVIVSAPSDVEIRELAADLMPDRMDDVTNYPESIRPILPVAEYQIPE